MNKIVTRGFGRNTTSSRVSPIVTKGFGTSFFAALVETTTAAVKRVGATVTSAKKKIYEKFQEYVIRLQLLEVNEQFVDVEQRSARYTIENTHHINVSANLEDTTIVEKLVTAEFVKSKKAT